MKIFFFTQKLFMSSHRFFFFLPKKHFRWSSHRFFFFDPKAFYYIHQMVPGRSRRRERSLSARSSPRQASRRRRLALFLSLSLLYFRKYGSQDCKKSQFGHTKVVWFIIYFEHFGFRSFERCMLLENMTYKCLRIVFRRIEIYAFQR